MEADYLFNRAESNKATPQSQRRNPMFIIDSQVHIWAPETPEKPYAKENASPPHRIIHCIPKLPKPWHSTARLERCDLKHSHPTGARRKSNILRAQP